MRKVLGVLGLLVLGLLFAQEASATILFMGGEGTDFTCAPSGTCATSGAFGFRSSFARSALTASGNVSGTNDPPPDRFLTPVFTAVSSLWLHLQMCAANCLSNSNSANYSLLGFIDSNGVTAIVLRATGVANQLKISSRTSGGVFTDLVTCSNAYNLGITQMDINLTFGSSGSITLYRDSISVCTYSGNTLNGDGATTIDQAVFGGGINNSGASTEYSEVVVATTDSRQFNLLTLYPTGSGNTTDWTGANPCTAILNHNPFNDASYISALTSGLIEECTVYNTIPTGAFNVLAVAMSMRGLNGGSGPQNFDFVTRTGGTDYFSSDILLNNSMHNYGNYIQIINPNTGVAWTTGDLTAAGFNIGGESKP